MNEFIDLLKDLPAGGISALGFAFAVFLMIYKGLLIPSTTYNLIIANWETMMQQKIDENNMLKEAYRLSEKARETNADTIPELLELAKTTVHLLESIHERADRTEDT